MSTPVLRLGPDSFPVKTAVKKFRLVKLEEGGISHADASSDVFGAVAADGQPASARDGDNTVVHGPAQTVAVHYGPATVRLEVDGTASDIKMGAKLYAAADGKATASAGSTPAVAVAVRNGGSGVPNTIIARLLTPVFAS
ncbi:hypothetical protein [Corynebacterium pygosceleis]|uniref:DUF2190 domain-containing protein n=1 Tax=Corynebacterium pygosceleis TaxID=2800406 RepID=A0ABT3WUC1_9CORY|nr:hypothetical protein [Corynebacterium pygosceleis]MCK7676374.1 hypothetical protein [Corynebacterium pygosceleis]MCX7445827.1 hypothetical protein [Corynebacterium pygosceleis]